MVAEVNLGDEQSTFAKHPAAFDDGGLREPEVLKGGMGPDEVELLGLKRQGLPITESVCNPAPASPLLGDIFRDIHRHAAPGAFRHGVLQHLQRLSRSDLQDVLAFDWREAAVVLEDLVCLDLIGVDAGGMIAPSEPRHPAEPNQPVLDNLFRYHHWPRFPGSVRCGGRMETKPLAPRGVAALRGTCRIS